MGIFSKLNPFRNSATMKEPEWWRQALGASLTNAGVSVTPENAMKLTAVFSAVRIISESIASLPLVLYERDGDRKRLAVDHPLFTLLHDIPNDVQTNFELLEFGMANLLLRGNQYNHVVRNGRGEALSITPLKAAYMKPENGVGGKINFNYQEPGNERVYRQDEIWRTAGLGSDGVIGLSPIQEAKQPLGIGMAAENYGAKVYSNGAQVPAVLESEHRLTDEQFKALKEQWSENYGGLENAFKTAILEGGLKYKNVGLNLSDAEFIASRKMTVADVSRIYRVPLHMLSELDKATFSNIEHQGIEFVVHTIRPWVTRLEKSITRDLLLPSERGRYFAKFKLEGLLRGDTKSRYEAYGLGIRDGWLNRNEVRELEDRDPVEGLDEFILPLNMAEQNGDPAMNSLRAAEVKALTVESKRLTDRQFKDWAPDFYARFEKRMVREGTPEHVAADYCANRVQVIQHQEDISQFIKELNHE